MSMNTKEIIDPTHPLLEANRSAIESVKRKTFQYGQTDRHQLDVYYPPSGLESNTNPPILVFFYGGGFSHGARNDPPQNLVYANVGAFFASRGILTVIPDYRLAPSVQYPGGSEDVRDALLWVAEHMTHIKPKEDGKGEDTSTPLYILGHSAGGVHVCGFLLSPSFLSALPPHVHIRGVALMGVPYDLTSVKSATQYYGSIKNIRDNHPLALLRRCDSYYVANLPPLRNILARSEPKRISSSTRPFVDLFRQKGGIVEEFVLEGHDHLSPLLALSTDVSAAERWGQDIVEWVRSSGANC